MKKEQFLMLTKAASTGDLEVIGDLCRQGLPLDGIGQESKMIALHWAALKGQVAVAKFLLERTAKISIDHQDKEGNTPLNLSVLNGGKLAARLNMIECLLDLGADPLIPNCLQKNTLNEYGSYSGFQAGKNDSRSA
jgi:ankyrin repeat protein